MLQVANGVTVIYTNHDVPGLDLSVERIDFNEDLWINFMLPGLLYFYERAVVPELLMWRVKRLNKLHVKGVCHIPFQLHARGFYTSELKDGGLRTIIRRVT